MPRTTSYTLGEPLNRFIRDQVDSGAYQSASEVVREALEAFAAEKSKEAQLAAALKEGEDSGEALTHDEVWTELRKRARARKKSPAHKRMR
jgi:antitoxin ParD1/3/4